MPVQKEEANMNKSVKLENVQRGLLRDAWHSSSFSMAL